jgi:hypothetical protein
MALKWVIVPLLLVVGCAATIGQASSVADRSMGEHNGREAQVRCSVSTTDVVWPSDAGSVTVAPELYFEGPTQIRALPSIRLVALPKRPGLEQAEYWAPFDLANGGTTTRAQTIKSSSESVRRPIRVVPGKLLWAPTKSSVWPSREFAKAVPRGHYGLRIQLELDGGETLSSNEIEITVK